jgi:tetratricopeptide (TPR) repeat protein
MAGMRTLCGLAMMALVAGPVEAADDWTYGASEHFEVYTTGNAAKARQAMNDFERMHAFFSDVLKVAPQTTVPTRLIIFSNEREFAPYRPNEGTAAFYQSGPDRDYIVMRALDAESYPIVVHEYWHLIVRHLRAAELPVWMSEGWAEYYSTLEARGDSMAVGRAEMNRLRDMNAGRFIPFDQLFAVRRDSPEYNDKRLMGQLYAQSWALVHMLLSGNDYYQQGAAFLKLILAGTDSATAITTAYGRPLEQVARDLQTYVRIARFQLRVFDYAMPKVRKDLETRAATSFEGRLVTANLQAISLSGEDAARAAFAELEKENEAHLELQESIATFEHRRGNDEVAEPHFARAVALGSTSWSIYRDYAYATRDGGRRLDLLDRALALNPDDLDLRLRFVDQLVRANRDRQAIAILAYVKNVDRTHAFSFFQLSAVANGRIGRMEQARAAGDHVVTFAVSPEEKAFASRLVASLTPAAARLPEPAAGADLLDAGAAPVPVTQAPGTSMADRPQTPRVFEVADGVVRSGSARDFNGSDEVMVATFQALDCTAVEPVLQFRAAGATVRLSMLKPEAILIQGAGGATVDLMCGTQGDRAVRVGYTRLQTSALQTAGDVRYLEFK